MAGIYIHIPFCVQRCGYCDFYSNTRLSMKTQFVKSLKKEIIGRSKELRAQKIRTIYFGGGTPSLLNKRELEEIFGALKQACDLSEVEEITIEVNPDDVTEPYLIDLKETGFNRLSMGIQSFNDQVLTFMNRRHDANEAFKAVQLSQQLGFDNLSIDLIYGIPDMCLCEWEETIRAAIRLNVQHISAYHLTFEQGTDFYKKLKKGIVDEVDEKDSLEQYNVLVSMLESSGFEDYEISNFCRSGYESKHNSNYWTGNDYMGFGPSAHSYLNKVRRWNISDLSAYVRKITDGESYFEEEILTETDIYNETIMLGLRTSKGLDINSVVNSNKEIKEHFLSEMKTNIDVKNVYEEGGFLKVCRDKKFLTDKIISDFFMV